MKCLVTQCQRVAREGVSVCVGRTQWGALYQTVPLCSEHAVQIVGVGPTPPPRPADQGVW